MLSEGIPWTKHGSIFRKKRPFHSGQTNTTLPLPENVPLETDVNFRPSTTSSTSTTTRRRESSISSLTELRSTLQRRSASLRSQRPGSPAVDNLANSNSPGKRSASTNSTHPSLTGSTLSSLQKPLDDDNRVELKGGRPPTSSTETRTARGLTLPHGLRKEDRPSVTGQGGPESDPAGVFQHIQDLASKRILALEYVRKAHEGSIFWFNTLLFTKTDFSKVPYFEARKLARRATNYLLLGISIPAILDPNLDNPIDYLRAFNALLTEFESYQSLHSPDGSSSSAVSRARIPQMFKRAALASGPKSRRGSSAESLPALGGNDQPEWRSISMGHHSTRQPSSLPYFPASDQDLVPGEEYQFLLTPLLPFDPDYFETFATLCDILTDCYTTVAKLINSPEMCVPGIGDLFSKADAKVRKIFVGGMVKDFEDASKQGIKSEIAGVGKLVLGGLM